MPPVTLPLRQAAPGPRKVSLPQGHVPSAAPWQPCSNFERACLPHEPAITFPRLSLLTALAAMARVSATGLCTPPLTRASCSPKDQGTGHPGSRRAPNGWLHRVSPLPRPSPRTFSRPSSFRLMMSRSKSVRKPLVLLKTIRPVNPSH